MEENSRPQITTPESVAFNMDVPGDLHAVFKDSCGMIPMTQVTRQLWRFFIALSPRERYDVVNGNPS